MDNNVIISHEDAERALDDMHDFALMPASVDPVGAMWTLTTYIKQQREKENGNSGITNAG